MAVFKKTVLKVGNYQSPDGNVEVTPERLRHWETMHKKLKVNKQVVPCNWDHLNDPVKAVPMSQDSFKKKRSARDTVGHLREFRVADDGQSAELSVQVLKKDAESAAKSNSVYVSPVIYPQWKDGGGNEYTDVITHVDFVNHPVDHSQGPFVPTDMAIRMSTDIAEKNQVVLYRLAVEDEIEDEENDDDEEVDVDIEVEVDADDDNDGEAEVDAEAVPAEGEEEGGGEDAVIDQLLTDADLGIDSEGESLDDMDADAEDNLLEVDDDDLFSEGEADEEEVVELSEEGDPLDPLADPDALVEPGMEAEVEPEAEPINDKITADLERAGIAAPEIDADADPRGFLMYLCGVLRQKAMDEGTLDDSQDDLVEMSPDIATLSLQLQNATRRAETSEAKLIESSRNRITETLDGLFKTGRITGEEHEQYSTKLTTVRMSLNDEGGTIRTDVDAFIESRETLPLNAVAPEGFRAMSLDGKEDSPEAPEGWSAGSQLTGQDVRQFVDEQAKKFPGQLRETKS